MSVRHLDKLFRPTSIAVIGASTRPGRVGTVVMENLLQGGFRGPVLPVNPKYQAVAGVLAYPGLGTLPLVPDLAVICTPAATVPGLIAELGDRGTRAAIVLSAGLSAEAESGKTLREEMLEAARPHQLRILGPNCLGLLSPGVGLNASFSHLPAREGNIAFVSQSGALCTAVLDWASPRGIGFSHFVSLGDSTDIDFADVVDWLSGDTATRSILLYIESISNARKFISAARAAARNKTVLAIKAGREAEGAAAAASHTGALAGSDEVYGVAIRRSGMLRVYTIDELFGAVETLARAGRPRKDHLTILTNGGGPGVLATDTLVAGGGELLELPEPTIAALDEILPATWSRANPVDIIGDADEERYGRALDTLLREKTVESILVLHVPTAISSSVAAARAVAHRMADSDANVLTSWLGQDSAEAAREILVRADVPTYDTPEAAVRAFLHTVRYRRNQNMLMETPPSIPTEFSPRLDEARAVVESVLAEGRSLLTEPEAKAVLAAYGVPVVRTVSVATPAEAVQVADELGYPVALKVLSRDISHKSDVGGVVLHLGDGAAVARAADEMLERIRSAQPEAHIEGFTVQEMIRRPGAHELIVGITTDQTFGPVVLFGQGGTAVEVIGDKALALPPLNMNLAQELIGRTRVSRLLRGYRDRPAVDFDAISLTLIQVSQLVIDIPEVVELDINPLFADENGVIALDARIVLTPHAGEGGARLAICPYPSELEEWVTLDDGQRVMLRPIRPEDEPAHVRFLESLTPEDIHFRFFGLVRSFPHSQMARFTQIDYDREMAFIASTSETDGETRGVVRAVQQPGLSTAEFAIVVRSDLKRQRLGSVLLEKLISYCRAEGVSTLVGQVLSENEAMLGLAESLGFHSRGVEPGVVEVRLDLTA